MLSPSPTWWRRLGQNRLLDVAAVVLAALSVVRIVQMLPAQAARNDFAHYYLAGKLWNEGRDVYRSELAPLYAEHGFHFEPDVPRATNPPPLVALFAPLSRLPVGVAFWCWAGIQALGLAAILWLAHSILGDRLSRRGWLFVVCLTLISASLYWHFYYSQTQLLLGALLLGAYRLRRQATAACLLVCAAGLLKLFPLVLLPFFVRSWRTAAAAAVFLAGIVLLTGLNQWQGFVAQAMPVVAANAVNSSFTFSLPALVAQLDSAAHGFAPPAAEVQFWLRVGVVIGLLGIAAAYVVRADPETRFALLLVAMLAGNASTRGHYLVMLVFPLALLATRVSLASGCGLALIVVALNLQETMRGEWFDRSPLLKVLAIQAPLYGMLALAALLWKTRRAEQGK